MSNIVDQSVIEKKEALEKKYGSYKMRSNLFDYEELSLMSNFNIIKYKGAMYRGQISHIDKREG